MLTHYDTASENVAELSRRVMDLLLVEEHWTKYRLAITGWGDVTTPTDPDAVHLCLYAAVIRAENGKEFSKAANTYRYTLCSLIPPDPEEDPEESGNTFVQISTFNDSWKTTFSTLRALLTQADKLIKAAPGALSPL